MKCERCEGTGVIENSHEDEDLDAIYGPGNWSKEDHYQPCDECYGSGIEPGTEDDDCDDDDTDSLF